jgi:hypothetical protein
MRIMVLLLNLLENRHLTSEADIEKAFALGEYIKRGMHAHILSWWIFTHVDLHGSFMAETLALYSLAKYRHLRRAYPPAERSP